MLPKGPETNIYPRPTQVMELHVPSNSGPRCPPRPVWPQPPVPIQGSPLGAAAPCLRAPRRWLYSAYSLPCSWTRHQPFLIRTELSDPKGALQSPGLQSRMPSYGCWRHCGHACSCPPFPGPPAGFLFPLGHLAPSRQPGSRRTLDSYGRFLTDMPALPWGL